MFPGMDGALSWLQKPRTQGFFFFFSMEAATTVGLS